jgi:hypothetical protein
MPEKLKCNFWIFKAFVYAVKNNVNTLAFYAGRI